MTAQSPHHNYMAHALRLARNGYYTTAPNPRVGCVLVKSDRVVGEGWHARAGGPHAEVVALRQAGDQAHGATAYVTLEPCCHQGRTPPCTDALLAADVKHVVTAMQDPNPAVAGKGLAMLEAAGITVTCGIMQAQAEALNRGFVQRMRSGRPWVVSKLAMSLDGRTAMASGESKWITSADSRRQVHLLRASSSAIMCGIGTILADDPALTVRLDKNVPEGGWLQPLRVIVDSGLQTPDTAKILQTDARCLIFFAQADPERQQQLESAGAELIHMPAESGQVDLAAVLDHLGKLQVNDVLLETGATLNGAMLQAGLINELRIYMAPHLMGSDGRGLFDLPGLTTMQQRHALTIEDIRAIGSDWCITATIHNTP